MKEKLFEWNLWRSIEASLRFQCILCVSPFYLDRSTGKLKSSWPIKVYTSTMALGLLVIMYYAHFHLHFMDNFIAIIPNGIVWRILCYYVFGAINVHYVFNMFIIVIIGLNEHMEFLEKIHSIDKRFQLEFNASVNHKNYKRKLYYCLAIFIICYGIHWLPILWSIIHTGRYKLALPSIVFTLQNIILDVHVYTLANYLFLIQNRYLLTLSVYQKIYRDYVLVQKTGTFDEKKENTLLKKFSNIFELFRDITQLIAVFNNAFGYNLASHIIRTFTSNLMQLYALFLILSDVELGKNRKMLAASVIYDFIGVVFRMTLIAIAIHSIYTAVI